MLCLCQTSIVISFPGCKINIGLNIISKRNDGFHNLQSIFYPVSWSDVIEVNPSIKTQLFNYGTSLKIKKEDNIVWKAYQLIKNDYNLNPIHIHLLKNVPNGAGLGGGSADGSSVLNLLNSKFNLNISNSKLEDYAATLGSDCPFFINNIPRLVTGRGEILKPSSLSLKEYYLYIVHPEIHISTQIAFSNIKPKKPNSNLKDLVVEDIKSWKNYVINDFEKAIFKNYSILELIKNQLYDHGAIYASMTGTGSSMYGLFNEKPKKMASKYISWIGKLN